MCYLSTPTDLDKKYIYKLVDEANRFVDHSDEKFEKFISKNWSFSQEYTNKKDKRLYFSYENALELTNICILYKIRINHTDIIYLHHF